MVVEFGMMGKWFPSGHKIICVGWSEKLQSAQVFEINLVGTNRKQLTNLDNTRYLSGPVVSPDGKYTAFANIDDQSTTELFLLNYESGVVHK
jgi:Tol biopolymer transport system component